MTDLAVGLLRHGYTAVERDRTSRRVPPHVRAYAGRLTGRRAVVVRGPAGVRAFYDETLVARAGAVPPPVAHLIFGRGAVHALDGEEHRDRRALFLEALADPQREALVARVVAGLERSVRDWPGCEVVVHDQLVEVYGRAVLEWSGVDVLDDDVPRLAHELACVVDGFGAAGRAYVSGWRARLRSDRWAREQVERVREGSHVPPPDSALARVAARPELDARTAGVELLNLLRPTVAVAWLGTFAAVALQRSPGSDALATATTDRRHHAFAQEVRRTTPFVPVLAGRALRSAEGDGVPVRPGDFLVLDVWGSDNDPSLWADARFFVPQRFERLERLDLVPEHLVPQGGGPLEGHRCPGEPLTERMLAETVRVIAGAGARLVGHGRLDPTRIPTLPDHGVTLTCPAPSGRAEP